MDLLTLVTKGKGGIDTDEIVEKYLAHSKHLIGILQHEEKDEIWRDAIDLLQRIDHVFKEKNK